MAYAANPALPISSLHVPSSANHEPNYLLQRSDYAKETVRLKSYVDVSGDTTVPAISLANAGFVPVQKQGEVWCPFCGLKLKDFHPSHNPLVWHRVHSKNCPFLKNNQCPDSASAAEFAPVISLPRANDDTMDVEQQTEESSEVQQSDGQITLLNDAQPTSDGIEGAPSNSPEELNKLYHSNCILRRIVPKPHIDDIVKPWTRLVSYLSTFNYERHRKLTFISWPKKEAVSPRALAASGFIYLQGTEDTVECVYCKVHIDHWTTDMVPDDIHQKKSPHCQYMQGAKAVKNIPDAVSDIFDDGSLLLPSRERQMELGIITESSKHPEFAVETRRAATFLTWPAANKKLASEMKEHQLFYTGRDDVVSCFSCGTEMSRWESTENIWRRHARQAPQCQLVIQEKGADWVTQIIEEHGHYHEPSPEPTINTVATRMLRPRMDNPATQAVLMMINPEYKREEVRNALIHNIKYGGSDCLSRADLVRAMLKRRTETRQFESVKRKLATEPAPPVVVSIRQGPVNSPGQEDSNIASDKSAHPETSNSSSGIELRVDDPHLEDQNAHEFTDHQGHNPDHSTSLLQSNDENLTVSTISQDEITDSTAVNEITTITFAAAANVDSMVDSLSSLPLPEQESYNAGNYAAQALCISSKETRPTATAIMEQAASISAEIQNSKLMCKVCRADEIEIKLVPCGHLVCCLKCSSEISECPECKQETRGTVKLSRRRP